MIDLHCHILPGLDDGAADIEQSLAMARMAVDDGVRAMLATPHVAMGSWNPSRDAIMRAANHLRERIRSASIPLKLGVGSELPATADIKALADAGEVITLGEKGRFLLIELPFSGHLGAMDQQLFELEVSGYKILLGHPERAMCCLDDEKLLPKLRDRGYWVQVNAGSVAGRQGRKVRNTCIRWLREGLVDVIASDGHGPGRRRPLLSPARKTVLRIGGEELWQKLTFDNPARVLDPRR